MPRFFASSNRGKKCGVSLQTLMMDMNALSGCLCLSRTLSLIGPFFFVFRTVSLFFMTVNARSKVSVLNPLFGPKSSIRVLGKKQTVGP